MSRGRIFVKVKDPSYWKKLFDLQIKEEWGFHVKTGKEIFDIEGDEFYIDKDWFPEVDLEYPLFAGIGGFMDAILCKLGQRNCIVIADVMDISELSGEGVYVFCCLGEDITDRLYGYMRKIEEPPADITDVEGWLKWTKIPLGVGRSRHLYGFPGSKFDFVRKESPVHMIEGLSAEEQKRGRLYISVKNLDVWKTLAQKNWSNKNYKFNMNLSEVFNNLTTTDFVLDENWHLDYGEIHSGSSEIPLRDLVDDLRKVAISRNCIIIADVADPNVSPSYIAVTAIGGKVESCEIQKDLSKIPITDVKHWLEAVEMKSTSRRLKCMAEFPSEHFEFARERLGLNAINPASSGEHKLNGMIFAITGDVHHYANRKELQQYIEEQGGKVSSSVTAKTSYLITNTPNSGTSKNVAARKLHIPIITEEEFISKFADVSGD